MRLVVGRVGRPHGIRGDVLVRLHTDDPGSRFAVGTVMQTEPAGRGPLKIRTVRHRPGGLIISFDGVVDRDGADALRGTDLVVESDQLPALDDPDEFYDHQLAGLAVVLTDGRPLGTVGGVMHTPAGDLLAVRREQAAELFVPFVRAIVPEVDVAGGRLVVDPPDGLLEL
ncbi:MAG: ribosome maturation factor RimM [Mycobacteriales bacterium]